MVRNVVVTFAVVSLMCAALLFGQGCTFHFKASELEMSGEQSIELELESVDFLRGQDS